MHSKPSDSSDRTSNSTVSPFQQSSHSHLGSARSLNRDPGPPPPCRRRTMQLGQARLLHPAQESLARSVHEADASLASNDARNVMKTFVSVTMAQCRATDAQTVAFTANSAAVQHLSVSQANRELRLIRPLPLRLAAQPKRLVVLFVGRVPLLLLTTPPWHPVWLFRQTRQRKRRQLRPLRGITLPISPHSTLHSSSNNFKMLPSSRDSRIQL